MNPDWEYILWTDEDLRNLIKNDYSWFLETYDGYPHHIQRVDAGRYFLMHKYGGVYADLDMQCLVPFDNLLQNANKEVTFGEENQIHNDKKVRVGNALIISTPNSNFWNFVFEELYNRAPESHEDRLGTVFTTTGPTMIHEVVQQHPEYVLVLDSQAFYPMPWHKPDKESKLVSRNEYPTSWSVHHWKGTWKSETKFIQINGIWHAMNRTKELGIGSIEKTIYMRKIYRQDVVNLWKSIIQSGDTAIQVGAYNGFHTVHLANLVDSTGTVHAFEPNEQPRKLLDSVLKKNNFQDRVMIHPTMAWSTEEPLQLVSEWNPKRPQRNVWRSSNSRYTQWNPQNSSQTIMGAPLDTLFDQIENLALIDIIAHGEEYHVIHGAEDLIRKYKPVITLELWTVKKRTEYGSQFSSQQTVSLLQRYGYYVENLQGQVYVAMPMS